MGASKLGTVRIMTFAVTLELKKASFYHMKEEAH